MSITLEEHMHGFVSEYCEYIRIKKTPMENNKHFQSIKANLMLKLAKITNFILKDDGVFIKKFSKFVAKKPLKEKVTVATFLSILLDIEIDPDFDFDNIMMLDIKFRFLILFYIMFNFIVEPNDKLSCSQLLPALNQCIYELNTQGKCPVCKIIMAGEEYLLNNNFYYCRNCYHKHIIGEYIMFKR